MTRTQNMETLQDQVFLVDSDWSYVVDTDDHKVISDITPENWYRRQEV